MTISECGDYRLSYNSVCHSYTIHYEESPIIIVDESYKHIVIEQWFVITGIEIK
jgi:hypothetical protein